MSCVRRALFLVVFGLFFLTLLLRPITRLVSRGFTGEGFDASVLFLAAPGVVVLLVMLFVGIVVLRRTEDDSDVGEVLTMRGAEQTRNPETVHKAGEKRKESADAGSDTVVDTPESGNREPPSFLSGQGGTRNKGFEIEEEPPETELDDHMQYLQEQLGEDTFDAEAEDETTLDEGDAEELSRADAAREDEVESTKVNDDDAAVEGGDDETTDSPTPIPAECPQPYCDATWESGGLFGGGNYEVLHDEQVRCEECGGITTLE